MRNFTFVFALFCASLSAYSQSQADKQIIQSFSAEGVETIIIKIDGDIEFKRWNHPKVSVQTSLIPVTAKYKVVEILAETGDYDRHSDRRRQQ